MLQFFPWLRQFTPGILRGGWPTAIQMAKRKKSGGSQSISEVLAHHCNVIASTLGGFFGLKALNFGLRNLLFESSGFSGTED